MTRWVAPTGKLATARRPGHIKQLENPLISGTVFSSGPGIDSGDWATPRAGVGTLLASTSHLGRNRQKLVEPPPSQSGQKMVTPAAALPEVLPPKRLFLAL